DASPGTGGTPMGTATMGRVVVSAKIENLEDQYKAHQGLIPPDQVRTLVVDDALVDTGATGLMIPTRLLATLGLRPTGTKHGRTAPSPAPPPHTPSRPTRPDTASRCCRATSSRPAGRAAGPRATVPASDGRTAGGTTSFREATPDTASRRRAGRIAPTTRTAG